MMLPILISVSVAPVSYFFCASAPLADAARTTRAAERVASRSWNAGIVDLPGSCECVAFFDRERFAALGPALNTFRGPPARKSPLRPLSQRAFDGFGWRPKDRR